MKTKLITLLFFCCFASSAVAQQATDAKHTEERITDDSSALFKKYNEEGLRLCAQQDYSSAIKSFNRAACVVKKEKGKIHPDYALSLSNLANCYCVLGDYAKAFELGILALEIRKRVLNEHHPDYAVSLNNIAYYYSEVGDYAKAIELNTQALEIHKKTISEDDYYYAILLNNLAVNYAAIGDYANAIELEMQVLKICKQTLNTYHPDYARSLNNLALYYNKIGDYAKALELGTQALKIRRIILGENHLDYARSLNILANCYCGIGDYAKAVKLITQVLESMSYDVYIHTPELSKDYYTVYIESLSVLANCLNVAGDYAKAIELNTQALEIHRKTLGESHPEYATLLNNLTLCYYGISDYAKAIEFCTQALRICRKTVGDDHSTYALALANMGGYYYKLGNTKKLLPIWNKHFDIDKRYILSQFRSMTEYQRKTLWSKTSMQIIKANHTYAPLGKSSPDACKTSYNSLLFAKGLILSSSIEFDRVINESGNKELLKTFEELRTTQRILNTLYNKPIAERPAGETERLEARANELEKVLIAGSKEYADFTRYLSVEWEDVRNALSDKDVAIEFIAGTQLLDNTTKPYYAALVLRKGWDSPKYVELMTEEELTEHYKRGAHIYSGYGALELYNRIWAKLEPYLSEGDNVYFAPDGLLHQMNVELFYDVNRKRANEKYNLYRVSSTREVCLDRATIKKSSAVLYGGLQYNMSNDSLIMESKRYRGTPTMVRFSADSLQRAGWEPLPGTKREVDSIDVVCKAHNVKSDIYTATVGNEESFKALSGKKTPIIHIATHGFFFKNEEREKNNRFFERMSIDQQGPRKPDNSMKRSGLIFAGGQRAWLGESIPEGIEDGILLAEEISTMDLSGTDIVVLSACQTGLGEITSDGVFGLQRAFKKAGVKTIIMSLWSVEDAATSLFMRTFYREWLGGKSKRDAFATAQAVTRAYNNDASSWAAFVMLDDYQK